VSKLSPPSCKILPQLAKSGFFMLVLCTLWCNSSVKWRILLTSFSTSCLARLGLNAMNIAIEKQPKKSRMSSITCMLTVNCSVGREVSCQLWSAQPASAKRQRDARAAEAYERLICRSHRYSSQVATGSLHTDEIS
jgi:hypothetical protein